MERLTSVFAEYLQKTGQIEIQLGKRDATVITREHSQLVIDRIDKESLSNNRMITIIISMYIAVYLIGIFLMFYFLNSPAILVSIFGGISVTPIFVVKELKRLWTDKNIMDIVRVLAVDIPPNELVKIIKSIYYSEGVSKQ